MNIDYKYSKIVHLFVTGTVRTMWGRPLYPVRQTTVPVLSVFLSALSVNQVSSFCQETFKQLLCSVFLIFWQRFDQVLTFSANSHHWRIGINWRYNYVISSKECITNRWTSFYSEPQRSAVLATAIPSVHPYVRLSVRLSHAGIVSKRLHVAWCSLHCQIAKCV